MAVLFITEYAEAVIFNGQIIPAGVEPALAYQTIAIGAGSVQAAAALDAKTKFVRLHTDAICHFKVGTNPTAVTTESRMPDEGTEFFGVSQLPGGTKIAVIAGV